MLLGRGPVPIEMSRDERHYGMCLGEISITLQSRLRRATHLAEGLEGCAALTSGFVQSAYRLL